jgi:Type I phosphodiesterase / nucleotide pyrophosphatase
MNVRRLVGIGLVWMLVPSLLAGQQGPAPRRNLLIFVADGLRHGSVTEADTPALWAVRTEGVHFANSHALFPTFTMANASAIATGHGLGDTGTYANTIWSGFAAFDTGNFGLLTGTPTPFIENDRVLSDLDAHGSGNFVGETSLVAMARAHGYQTALIGKVGPTAMQDVAALAPVDDLFPSPPPTIIIDDVTGTGAGIPLPPALVQPWADRGCVARTEPVTPDCGPIVPPIQAPARTNGYGATSQYNNGYTGDRLHAGTLAANVVQQQWFADVATKVVLPVFTAKADTPFVLVFWSRDPDGSQHDEGDSLNSLYPGINGESSRLGVENADHNLQQLMDWLDAHPAVKANTDVVVTSDHGFATISRREIDRTGRLSSTVSAKHDYVDSSGHVVTLKGSLPTGFLAIDLAFNLQMNLFDPDERVPGSRRFRQVHLPFIGDTWEFPSKGNGLLGIDIRKEDGSDARAIVAANGGSDLIFVPDHRADTVHNIVRQLLSYDYVDGVFVDDAFGPIAGTLPQSAINLVGASHMPRPAIVVTFKDFYMNPSDLQTAIQISDTTLQEGQGMHGGFGRDQTFNNMAAIGPDFKTRFVDTSPVGNADLTPTLAHVLGFTVSPKGSLVGRIAREALVGGPSPTAPPAQLLRSEPVNGRQTVLEYQELGGVRYLDAACFVAVGENCR